MGLVKGYGLAIINNAILIGKWDERGRIWREPDMTESTRTDRRESSQLLGLWPFCLLIPRVKHILSRRRKVRNARVTCEIL